MLVDCVAQSDIRDGTVGHFGAFVVACVAERLSLVTIILRKFPSLQRLCWMIGGGKWNGTRVPLS